MPVAEETPAVEEEPAIEEKKVEEIAKVVEVQPEAAPRKGRRWWIVAASVLGAAVLLLAAFAVLARIAPDFVDSILYTQEELDIIRQI